PGGELAIEVSPIAKSQVVHVQPPQSFDSAESWAFKRARQDEMHVDEAIADAVHAGEPHRGHERHACLGRRDLVWPARRDQRGEAFEEIAADVALALEELLDRVGAASVGQVPGNQLRAATRAFPEGGHQRSGTPSKKSTSPVSSEYSAPTTTRPSP